MQIKTQRHGDTEKTIYYDEKLIGDIISCSIKVHRLY